MPTQYSWSNLLPMHYTWTCLLSSMPCTQFMQHFPRGNTWVMFTLGNRSISYYAPQAIYVACQRGLLVNIQHRAESDEYDGYSSCTVLFRQNISLNKY